PEDPVRRDAEHRTRGRVRSPDLSALPAFRKFVSVFALMSIVSLVLRSLRFYWRTTLGVFAGAALASGILIGALAVGDSVRHTLEQQALARIGRTQLALSGANRFFREELATALRDDLGTPVAPLLAIRGTVSKP